MRVIILFLVLLLNNNTYAQTQEAQLKSNDWYVYKVVLNNQEYFTPNNGELMGLGANFGYSSGSNAVWENLCGYSELQNTYFTNDNQFEGFEWVSLAMTNCMITENLNFDFQFRSVFHYQSQNLIFYYEINDLNNNIKELIITNELGDKAYFYSTYLSSPSYVLEKVKVYPNPVQSVLNIELPAADYQNVLIDMYDVTGKKIKSFKEHWQENISLNIESLPAGNYLLELKLPNEPARGHFVKIIKE